MIFAPFSRYSTSSIPSLSQKTCHHPGGWILCSKHFWMRWTTVSPLLRMLFCLWIIQMYQCFIQCHKVSQETCCVLSKMIKNYLWSHNTLTLLICIQTFWHPLGRELSHDQHIMDDESYTFLMYHQSLCYLLAENFQPAKTMLWTAPTFSCRVTTSGLLGWSSSSMLKFPVLNRAIQFLTVE